MYALFGDYLPNFLVKPFAKIASLPDHLDFDFIIKFFLIYVYFSSYYDQVMQLVCPSLR